MIFPVAKLISSRDWPQSLYDTQAEITAANATATYLSAHLAEYRGKWGNLEKLNDVRSASAAVHHSALSKQDRFKASDALLLLSNLPFLVLFRQMCCQAANDMPL